MAVKWGTKLSRHKRNIIPARKPAAAGNQVYISMSSDISIAGIISDHTDAASITPDAKPGSSFSRFWFTLFLIRNTIALPDIVPINGINIPAVIYNLQTHPLRNFHCIVIL